MNKLIALLLYPFRMMMPSIMYLVAGLSNSPGASAQAPSGAPANALTTIAGDPITTIGGDYITVI